MHLHLLVLVGQLLAVIAVNVKIRTKIKIKAISLTKLSVIAIIKNHSHPGI